MVVERKRKQRKETSKSNPNGSNQHTNDIREQLMWDFYIEGLLQGIENAYAAAKKANYSEDHARNITLQGWFKERKAKLKRKDMLSKSEKVLEDTLDMSSLDKEGRTDPQLHKIKVDVAKTIVTTLGKDEGYSTRSEMTGKDGKDLVISFDSIFEDK